MSLCSFTIFIKKTRKYFKNLEKNNNLATFIDRKFGHMYPLEEWKKSTDKIWQQKPLPPLTKPIKIAKI